MIYPESITSGTYSNVFWKVWPVRVMGYIPINLSMPSGGSAHTDKKPFFYRKTDLQPSYSGTYEDQVDYSFKFKFVTFNDKTPTDFSNGNKAEISLVSTDATKDTNQNSQTLNCYHKTSTQGYFAK